MSFKVGDRIKMLESCFGNKKGDVLVLGKDSDGLLEAHGCTCHEKWQLLDKAIENIEYGDVVVDKDGGEKKVLARVNDSVLLSLRGDFDIADNTWFTIQELKSSGFILTQSEEDVTEVSMDEVAKKMGIPVNRLRIRKEE